MTYVGKKNQETKRSSCVNRNNYLHLAHCASVNTDFALIKRGVGLFWTILWSPVSSGGIPANVIWSLLNRIRAALVLVSSVCLFPSYRKLTALTSFLTNIIELEAG